MRRLTSKNYQFGASSLLLAGLCVYAPVIHAKSGGGGGGGKASAAIGLEYGYHHNAQTWVQGEKDQASFRYTGHSWLLYLTNNSAAKKEGSVSLTLPSIAVWSDSLTNAYHTTDPSGAEARETIKTQGVGVGLMDVDMNTGICVAMLIGIEHAQLAQTGDSPRKQSYPYGAGARIGLGWTPIHGTVSMQMRVDWTFKHFPSRQSGGDSLKVMEQQSFAPMIGISYQK